MTKNTKNNSDKWRIFSVRWKIDLTYIFMEGRDYNAVHEVQIILLNLFNCVGLRVVHLVQ
jgi:hypothetical protein